MNSHFTVRGALAMLAAVALLAGTALAASPQHVTGKYKGKTSAGKRFSASVKKKTIRKLSVTVAGTCQRGSRPASAVTQPFTFLKGDPRLKLSKKGKFGGTTTTRHNTPFGQDIFSQTLKGSVKGRKIKGSFVEAFTRHLGDGTLLVCTYPKVTFKGKHK